MNDSDIESALRRHRPIGPPPHLRDRVTTMRLRRVWPWAAAAAVLLISMLTLRMGARYEAATLDLRLEPAATGRVIENLAEMLGGTPDAREIAEAIVMEEQTALDQPAVERP